MKSQCSVCFRMAKYVDNGLCTSCEFHQKIWGPEKFQLYKTNNENKRQVKLNKIAEQISRNLDIEKRKKERAEKKLLNKYKFGSEVIETVQYDKVKCSKCKEIKLRSPEKISRISYLDPSGNKWEGRVCPPCIKLKWEKKNASNRKDYQEIICQRCPNLFKPLRNSQKYCSKKCQSSLVYEKKKRFCATCKSVIMGPGGKQFCSKECKPRKIVIPKVYNCLVCSIETPNRKFCSKKCKGKDYRKKYGFKIKSSPSYKKIKKAAKKLRKRGQKKAKLKSVPWSQIIDFYDNCPEGHVVDHIIPLNHPEVSGLHIPANFQYLPIKDNLDKSNRWDGTLENKNWKNSQLPINIKKK